MRATPWAEGIAGAVRGALVAAADLVLSGDCAGCRGPVATPASGPLCAGCRTLLARAATPSWPVPVPAGLPPPWSVATYDGPVRAALVAYKEDGRTALRRPLGDALARAVGAGAGTRSLGLPRRLVLVPMPSRPAAVRSRGRDHVRDLARQAAGALGLRGIRTEVAPVLRLVRATSDQSGLSASARATNLAGALGVRRGAAPLLAGATVVLVDDLVTTGATLAEAARALRAVGAEPVAAATVAATRRTRLRTSPALH